MRRSLVALSLGLATTLLAPSRAAADTGGVVVTDDEGADALAIADGSISGSSGSDCEYTPIDISDDVIVYGVDAKEIETDGTGQWYEKWCNSDFFGVVYLSPTDPADLLAIARRRLALPLPAPNLSPAGEQLVNLRTWMWIDPSEWVARSATAQVPGVSVTVTAVPEHTSWNMGDGHVVVCGPGTPFDRSLPESDQRTDCSYIYTQPSTHQPASAYAASVTVRWRLSWTVAGAAGGGALGAIDRTTSWAVPVAEVQALNVRVPNGSAS